MQVKSVIEGANGDFLGYITSSQWSRMAPFSRYSDIRIEK